MLVMRFRPHKYLRREGRSTRTSKFAISGFDRRILSLPWIPEHVVVTSGVMM